MQIWWNSNANRFSKMNSHVALTFGTVDTELKETGIYTNV